MSMKMHRLSVACLAVLVGALVGDLAFAQPHREDVQGILNQSGVSGGLCLVVGAKSPAIAEALADKSSLYVQMLQPDHEKARTWGMRVARRGGRDQLGVRNASFAADAYSSKLFNLIVVDDAASLGRVALADIYRILTPRGVVMFRRLPKGVAARAKQLDMQPVKVSGWEASFRRPLKPAQWKLPLALKWQAGPRSQIANGYTGIATGDGKLFYMERLELDEGDLNKSAAVVFARDAYNGRTLWTWEAPGGWNRYNSLAITSDGRLFARCGNSKVFRLDSATGKVLSEVVPSVHREARISLLNDDLFSVGGDIYSTKTGKFLWKFPKHQYQPMRGTIIRDNIYFCDGANLQSRRLADGLERWTKPIPKQPAPFGSLSRAGDYLMMRMKDTARRGGSRDECRIAILNPTDGTVRWSYTWKVRISTNERYFNASKVKLTTVGDNLLMYYRHNREGSYADEVVVTRLNLGTGNVEIENRVLKNAGDYHGCFPELQLGDYIAYYDLWINKKTLESSLNRMPHPACFFGMTSGNGLVYNFPSRKSGPITAVGPADATLKEGPGESTLKTFARATTSEETKPDDWPMFRGNAAGGNFTKSRLGTQFVKSWEASVGRSGKTFGVMSSQRTGLTQAVSAYGLVVVSDIDGQRIVALDAAEGKEKWVFHVGGRVDYPPTLYRGLCLFAARDGWVYCLDAKTGTLVYKLLAAPREFFIGGREKLESKWALSSDVLIANGRAYVSYEGGGLAFKPETGEIVEVDHPGEIALGKQATPGGRELLISYDSVIKGNSIPRTNEDNWHGFTRRRFGRNLDARVLAFDDSLTLAYIFKPKGQGWANKGWLHLMAINTEPKKPLWTSDPIELVVDDMVLTQQHFFCVGHYQRIKKAPELWVVSRRDGTVVSKMPVNGYPAFLGMSAAGGRLFIATREGKLICLQSRE
jgi:outer membrane protein assembly factor BamB